MGGFDDATWQALGLLLTLLGLGVSVLLWRRRGAASGLRGAAWSLLPLAAGLTGTLRLAGEVTEDVGRWATRLVFSPVVWSGLALAGVSVVLFVVSGMLRARGSRGAGGPRLRQPTAAGPGATPAVGAGGSAGSSGVEGMEDIDAILRKHGIS